ncbi:hypothetical protein TNCV_5095071 [Trichonephila clavipes]|nr:hypothetical protein TNCV_5095071 [Trichonephila clavipes]
MTSWLQCDKTINSKGSSRLFIRTRKTHFPIGRTKFPSATFSITLLASANRTFFKNRRYLSDMTENDAPESTRARIGFLSIITSSWLPVILAVSGGFPVHAASPPWKVALLSFPRSYGLATDWIGDMATGICNDVLGIGLSWDLA